MLPDLCNKNMREPVQKMQQIGTIAMESSTLTRKSNSNHKGLPVGRMPG
jgi:hypothetical protein